VNADPTETDLGITPPPGAPAGVNLWRYVVLRVSAGSRAFGLAVETSDDDRRGVYLPPAELTWSLVKPPEQIERKAPGLEEVCWELEKFLRLALQANPNILETLWSPVVLFADEVGEALRGLRTAFLSKLLYKTYSGYVASQLRLMRRAHERDGAYKPKHAMHLVRLLHSGLHALRTGDILVDVGDHRDELLAIRRGDLTFEGVVRRAEEIDRAFREAFQATRLPDQPDFHRVNHFLIAARRRRAEA
jgi:hypothetical protein